MNLINIANQGSTIYLFMREEDGKLLVKKDSTYKPFFYEPDPNGKYVAFDGKKLRKVVLNNPYDIKNMRSNESYSSDVRYPINYITQRVKDFTPCPVRYCFLDIEIKCKDFPSYKYPKDQVSCITLYDSFKKDYTTFFLKDMDEMAIFENIVKYMQDRKFDLILGWNVSFDYNYLFTRYMHLTNKDFAKDISIIKQYRFPSGGQNKNEELDEREAGIHFPAGTSILDYMKLFKKVNMREQSYALDNVAQKYLKEEPWPKTSFDEVSDLVCRKNMNDVVRMVKLEHKGNIINYFNEIRLNTKCLWEDLTFNSRIIDSVILAEAHKRGIVLPNKPMFTEKTEEESIQGAYRRSEVGFYENLYKTDIISSYPNQIITFCLDINNIVMEPGPNTLLLNGYYFKQDPTALLPSITKYFLEQKDKLKKEVGEANAEQKKLLKIKYDAIKGLVNSVFGATSLTSFRLYDDRVAGTITGMAREVMHYVEDALITNGNSVLTVDTDSLFYKADKDEIDYINQLVEKWAKEKYNKDSTTIKFDSEGMFTKILLLGKCHYYGLLKNKKGEIETEIKGVEMKRSSSSKFEAKFQEALIKQVMDKNTIPNVLGFIEKEKKRIRTAPLEEIGFPCKLRSAKYEKNIPIYKRAVDNTRKLDKNFNVANGELFYYVFAIPEVLAFTIHDQGFIDRDCLDWDEIIRRNILSKAEGILEALGYNKQLMICGRQEQLF